ncbi:MAG TPA: Gfo/Idh/MocA family oxidoreductase [Chloroflexota bacterium]|nr:Gfo/Idh/MocA family oxidoreductase [Chloroflexota bacterium]
MMDAVGGGQLKTPLRIGLIGLVSAYSLHYAEDLTSMPGVEIAGTVSLGRDERYIRDSLTLPWLASYPKTIQEYERRWNIPVLETTEELYRRGVDAVVICTEDYLRPRYAAEALSHDLHVLIPKPFASSLEEVRAIEGALAKSRGTVTPSLPLRYSGAYTGAKAILDSGELGDPLAIRGQVAHHLSFGPWKSDSTMAAGPEFEVGFYTVDAMCYLMSRRPTRVTAAARNFLHLGVPTFDLAKLLVEFDGGGLGSADLYCGNHFRMPSQEMEIVCSDGAMRIERQGARGEVALRVFTPQGERVETPPGSFRARELANWTRICREGDRAAAAALLSAGLTTLQVLVAFKQAWQDDRQVTLPLAGWAASDSPAGGPGAPHDGAVPAVRAAVER